MREIERDIVHTYTLTYPIPCTCIQIDINTAHIDINTAQDLFDVVKHVEVKLIVRLNVEVCGIL